MLRAEVKEKMLNQLCPLTDNYCRGAECLCFEESLQHLCIVLEFLWKGAVDGIKLAPTTVYHRNEGGV